MRRIPLCNVAAVTLFVVMMTAPAALGLLRQPFEGTKWKVTVTPDEEAIVAGEKEFEDVLVFKDNKFVSQACAPKGFKPVEYKENMAPGGITATFTAEPVSEKEGKSKWHGTKTGHEMRGEMNWTRKDGTVLNYTFKGERVES